MTTFEQVLDCAKRGVWIYRGERVTHPSWIVNMGLGCIDHWLKNRQLRLAFRSQKLPLFYQAHYGELGIMPFWDVRCEEGSRVEVPTVIGASEREVMVACENHARQNGHWGRVRVTFARDVLEVPF